MRICFTIGGTRLCIRIPVLIWPPWHRHWPPNGDPWKHLGEFVETPDPEPGRRESLTILASFSVLAEHAHEELRGRLEQVVHAEVGEINKTLPEGVSVELASKTR